MKTASTCGICPAPNGTTRVFFVADNAITDLAWVATQQLLVAGDGSGRLHWLELGQLQA